MKKILCSIVLIFSFIGILNAQKDNRINDSIAMKYANSFINYIQNHEFEKAYLILSDEKRENKSKDEFILYFENILQYYGELKNYNCEYIHITDSSTIIKEFSANYTIEFDNTKASFYLTLKYIEEDNIKLNSYFFITDFHSPIPAFNKMSEEALKLLKNKKYRNLYELMDWGEYSFLTYEKFHAKIKKLELDEKINYKRSHHYIGVMDETVIIELVYEINNIGNITFEYRKENELINLYNIRFYFTKEIEDAYKANLSIFMDTTSLLNNKNILSAADSTFLKKEFGRLQKEIRDAELKRISENIESDVFDNDISIGISYDWEQLDENDQKLIRESAEKYLLKLAEKDIKGFWELCHSKFKETTPLVSFNEVGMLIANMIVSIDSLEFIDAKKVSYSAAPKTSKFATGGSLDKSNPKYLQFYTLAGIKNQSLTLYKLKNKPLSKTITMKFGYEDSMYKLTSFDINTSSINGKDADYYIELANKWNSFESSFPRFIALNMAYRLSYIGKGISTTKTLDLTEKLLTLQKDSELISEIRKWNINDSIFDIINVDFIETQNDVTPNINYVSKVELGEESTEEEVKILFKYFSEKYPDLVQEFERFIFTAFQEYPAIPSKQYNYFRVIMDINEL